SQIASVFVLVRAGAIDEKQPGQSGLSHFLEHMLFKGSAKYPQGLFAAAEKYGAEMNASTGKQFTSYYINVPSEYIYEAIEMLSDAVTAPLFPQETIDRERNVIIEELYMRRDWTGFKLAEILEDKLYQGGVMKNNIGGDVSTISKVKREDLIEYYNSHYLPSRMTVSVSGGFDYKKAKKVLKDTFGKIAKRQSENDPNLTIENPKGANLTIRDNISAGSAAIAFLGPDNNSAEITVAAFAANVLYAELYKSLKIKRDLLNSIDVSFDATLGNGAFYIEYSFNPKHLNKIRAEIERQIADILENGISTEALNRAKISFKTASSFGLERQDNIAYNAAFWLSLNRKEFADPDAYLKEIDKVSAEDIRKFFKKYYSKEKTVAVTMLPRKAK
ncbi:MAG: insulinase family protein, partial [Elusimicrobiota bacterium]|nr:insulinase family protein [Elusimicrobiota bacterium]